MTKSWNVLSVIVITLSILTHKNAILYLLNVMWTWVLFVTIAMMDMPMFRELVRQVTFLTAKPTILITMPLVPKFVLLVKTDSTYIPLTNVRKERSVIAKPMMMKTVPNV